MYFHHKYTPYHIVSSSIHNIVSETSGTVHNKYTHREKIKKKQILEYNQCETNKKLLNQVDDQLSYQSRIACALASLALMSATLRRVAGASLGRYASISDSYSTASTTGTTVVSWL